MSYNRRTFLKNSALLSSGLVLSGASLVSCNTGSGHHDFGLQLYSLRDDLPKDPKGVLKQVSTFGYKQVEGYEGPMGMFWNMKHTEFKKYMDDLGMNMVSSHCDWQKDLEAKAAQAGEIGMKYLICPYLGTQDNIDAFKAFAAKFNEAGEICKKHGLRFAYHNHDYSFKPVNGQLPQDVLIAETDANLVDFEMDMYWVVDAGVDPVVYLEKHKDRFKLCHVKDRLKVADPNAGNNSCTLGEGSIDYPSILKKAKDNGVSYFIVEQELYNNTTPLKSAADNAAYMNKLGI
ncbi:sugar phosphate isomerase/epimerase [soil metagenome]